MKPPYFRSSEVHSSLREPSSAPPTATFALPHEDRTGNSIVFPLNSMTPLRPSLPGRFTSLCPPPPSTPSQPARRRSFLPPSCTTDSSDFSRPASIGRNGRPSPTARPSSRAAAANSSGAAVDPLQQRRRIRPQRVRQGQCSDRRHPCRPGRAGREDDSLKRIWRPRAV